MLRSYRCYYRPGGTLIPLMSLCPHTYHASVRARFTSTASWGRSLDDDDGGADGSYFDEEQRHGTKKKKKKKKNKGDPTREKKRPLKINPNQLHKLEKQRQALQEYQQNQQGHQSQIDGSGGGGGGGQQHQQQPFKPELFLQTCIRKSIASCGWHFIHKHTNRPFDFFFDDVFGVPSTSTKMNMTTTRSSSLEERSAPFSSASVVSSQTEKAAAAGAAQEAPHQPSQPAAVTKGWFHTIDEARQKEEEQKVEKQQKLKTGNLFQDNDAEDDASLSYQDGGRWQGGRHGEDEYDGYDSPFLPFSDNTATSSSPFLSSSPSSSSSSSPAEVTATDKQHTSSSSSRRQKKREIGRILPTIFTSEEEYKKMFLTCIMREFQHVLISHCGKDKTNSNGDTVGGYGGNGNGGAGGSTGMIRTTGMLGEADDPRSIGRAVTGEIVCNANIHFRYAPRALMNLPSSSSSSSFSTEEDETETKKAPYFDFTEDAIKQQYEHTYQSVLDFNRARAEAEGGNNYGSSKQAIITSSTEWKPGFVNFNSLWITRSGGGNNMYGGSDGGDFSSFGGGWGSSSTAPTSGSVSSSSAIMPFKKGDVVLLRQQQSDGPGRRAVLGVVLKTKKKMKLAGKGGGGGAGSGNQLQNISSHFTHHGAAPISAISVAVGYDAVDMPLNVDMLLDGFRQTLDPTQATPLEVGRGCAVPITSFQEAGLITVSKITSEKAIARSLASLFVAANRQYTWRILSGDLDRIDRKEEDLNSSPSSSSSFKQKAVGLTITPPVASLPDHHHSTMGGCPEFAYPEVFPGATLPDWSLKHKLNVHQTAAVSLALAGMAAGCDPPLSDQGKKAMMLGSTMTQGNSGTTSSSEDSPSPAATAAAEEDEDADDLKTFSVGAAATGSAKNTPFVLVHGPPGSGKTHTIAAMVAQFLLGPDPPSHARNRRVLICAPSNAAIDELAFRIRTKGLPVCATAGERYGDAVYHNGPERTASWFPRMVRIGVREKVDPWVLQQKDSPLGPIFLEDYLTSTNTATTGPAGGAGQQQPAGAAPDRYKVIQNSGRILSRAQVIFSTLGSMHQIPPHVTLPLCVLDEAGQATEPESLLPLGHAKVERLVLVGDPQQLRPLVLDEETKSRCFDRSLMERLMDVSLSFDERRKRREHHHQQQNLEMQTGLSSIQSSDTSTSQQQNTILPLAMLRLQYRMPPLLADYVSQTTYRGLLETEWRWEGADKVMSRSNRSSRFTKPNHQQQDHQSVSSASSTSSPSVPLSCSSSEAEATIVPVESSAASSSGVSNEQARAAAAADIINIREDLPQVLFVDVPYGAEQLQGTSFINDAECSVIHRLVRELQQRSIQAPSTSPPKSTPALTVGVIAFYAAQQKLIQSRLGPYLPKPSSASSFFSNSSNSNAIGGNSNNGAAVGRHSGVRVGTVDGFQGQEQDIMILSCVRTGADGFHSGGFVSNPNRVNVALTRARRCCVVVGHGESLRRQGGPLGDFLQYCEYLQASGKDRGAYISLDGSGRFSFSGEHTSATTDASSTLLTRICRQSSS